MSAEPFTWFTDADREILGDHICSKCHRQIDEDEGVLTLFRERPNVTPLRGALLIEQVVDVARFHEECLEALVACGILRLAPHKESA